MKTYLHRPIEILYFLPAEDFKNVSHNFEIFLHFNNTPSWVALTTRNFFVCYSYSYCSSMIIWRKRKRIKQKNLKSKNKKNSARKMFFPQFNVVDSLARIFLFICCLIRCLLRLFRWCGVIANIHCLKLGEGLRLFPLQIVAYANSDLYSQYSQSGLVVPHLS